MGKKHASKQEVEAELIAEAEAAEAAAAAAKPGRKRLHWLLAMLVLGGACTFFALSREQAPEELPAGPGPEATAEMPAAPADVLAQELNGTPPPAEGGAPVDLNADPNAPLTAADAPPPVTGEADMGAQPPAEMAAPDMNADMNQPPAADMGSEPTMAEEPPAPPPVKKAAKTKAPVKKAAAKPAAKNKYTLVFNKTGTKVPASLKKDKVLKYLSAKLNGDKTCIPASLDKKSVKPFTATVATSKTGSITSVDIKPKLPQAKAINACIKKKLAGNAALFKAKSASKITVALKVK